MLRHAHRLLRAVQPVLNSQPNFLVPLLPQSKCQKLIMLGQSFDGGQHGQYLRCATLLMA